MRAGWLCWGWIWPPRCARRWPNICCKVSAPDSALVPPPPGGRNRLLSPPFVTKLLPAENGGSIEPVKM
ncbi:hypothetical protein G6F55_014610 [Rhizopus delemar]|nr:hypothetical protein G6F55_014610 [Rhizopus delemar]